MEYPDKPQLSFEPQIGISYASCDGHGVNSGDEDFTDKGIDNDEEDIDDAHKFIISDEDVEDSEEGGDETVITA